MKLPLNIVLGPILKSHFGQSRLFCQQSLFRISGFYTMFYAVLGLILNINYLRKNLGSFEHVLTTDDSRNLIMNHDLKVISTSLGLFQYICLIIGCLTKNPALFMPHLGGQIITVLGILCNIIITIICLDMKAWSQIKRKLPSILLISFSWFQEFCTFRKYLCICDL